MQQVATVAGTSSASGLIELSTTAAHGFLANDIVQVLGTAGTVEANGQWVVSSVPDSSHLILATSHWSHAWTSGGILEHVGFVPGTISTPATINTITTRVESLTSGCNVRIVYEDATDSAYVTAEPLAAVQTGGGSGAGDGQYLTLSDVPFAALPDLRAGYLRVKVYLNAGPNASATVSAWVV
jgi:hypothetical protein